MHQQADEFGASDHFSEILPFIIEELQRRAIAPKAFGAPLGYLYERHRIVVNAQNQPFQAPLLSMSGPS
jgi:hypothetical protein